VSGLEILAVIAVIGFVIYQQVAGQALRGKRVVLLPVILTVIGFTDLHGSGKTHLQSADIVCLVIGAAGSIAVGLAFGAITRLESRDGTLWAKMPLRGLWLWVALIGWRVVVMLLANSMHAHVAASTTPLLFTLGLNRLAQAAVIMPRAMAAGIPFAPEKDGRTFLASAFNQSGSNGNSGSGSRTGQRDQRVQEYVNPLWARDERPYDDRSHDASPYDQGSRDQNPYYDERSYDQRSYGGQQDGRRQQRDHRDRHDHHGDRDDRRDRRRAARDDRWDRR
jgi:hypothetical protein